MPPSFTNKPGASVYRGTSIGRYQRPYVSGSGSGSVMPLTENEKRARQEARQKKASEGVFGFGVDPVGGANTVMSGSPNFFSPQLSTDFLQLPQSATEQRQIYRHFYNNDPIIHQAITLHTELPLSKIRLAAPRPLHCPEGFKDAHSYGKYILSFFTKMCSKIKLFKKLIDILHLYHLDGNTFIFAEDSTVDVPEDIGYSRAITSKIGSDGEFVEEDTPVELPDREEREFAYWQKHYKGLERLIILPIDQIKLESYGFTDKVKIQMIPSDRDRSLIEAAKAGDETAEEMVADMPSEVRGYIEEGKLIPLGTDPDEGSFVFHLHSQKASPNDEYGTSIIQSCHIAGTPVLTRRVGQVIQVPIEKLDPSTDQVLSHTGVWRNFEAGSRDVTEEVITIDVAKRYPPVTCTKDHKYPVLRDGSVVDIPAGDIRPGDFLRVSQVPLTGSVQRADLSEGMNGSCDFKGHKSGNHATLAFRVVDQNDQTLTIDYTRDQTDPRKQRINACLERVLDWLRGLSEPVSLTARQFCIKFDLAKCGISSKRLNDVIRRLTDAGSQIQVTKRGRRYSILFQPLSSGSCSLDVRVITLKTFPRYLDLTGALGYFLGYFLGDGSISGNVLGITYGKGVPASIRSIEGQIKPMLDKLGYAYSDTFVAQTNSGLLSCYIGICDPITRWISDNFGKVCESKHLPDWIFDAPPDFLNGLLRGFVDSDGDVVQKKGCSTVSVRLSNTNKDLLDQLSLVALSLGYPVSQGKPTQEGYNLVNGYISKTKAAYSTHFSTAKSVAKFFASGFLAKQKKPTMECSGSKHSGAHHVEYDGKLFYRVRKTSTTSHSGPVYSLNVHEDHTFYAGGCLTYNCLRLRYLREKLRQAQTQIADRAMTPHRVIWAEGMSDADTDQLREQVDLCLAQPDYSIVTNFEVHWEEMGSRDRLLDLSAEYDQSNKDMFAGLGVTESLLNGEATFGGDRVKLEVLNVRYLLLRERIQEYVEEYLFKPVARRKGFVEKDEWGEEVVLYPKLSFTRLALRDSQDTYDALFNLYVKGSIDIDVILELFNIDPQDTKEKIERDLFTVNDSIFSEVLRGLYGEAGRALIDKTDAVAKIAEYLKLKMQEAPAAEDPGRF